MNECKFCEHVIINIVEGECEFLCGLIPIELDVVRCSQVTSCMSADKIRLEQKIKEN